MNTDWLKNLRLDLSLIKHSRRRRVRRGLRRSGLEATEALEARVMLAGNFGEVTSFSKISDTAGNFAAALDNADELGTAVTSLGDLNGDGIADMAVGATGDDDGGTDRGAVYVLFMNSNGTVNSSQKISNTAGGFTAVLDDGDNFGNSLTNLGDLDGDGVTDIAVGAIGDDDGGSDRGAVYILFMNSDGTVKSHQKISDTAGAFTGLLDDDDQFGHAVTELGDLDGDGVLDLAVGAPKDDDGGSNRGAMYVLFLNTDGTVKSHAKTSDVSGTLLFNDDMAGWSLTNLGDLDGDGITDVAIGAVGLDTGNIFRGGLGILFLNSNGTLKGLQRITNTQGNFTGVLDFGDNFGSALTVVGDLDADGVADLAVGTRNDDDGGSGRGAVYVLFMNTDGTVKAHQKISDTFGNFTAILEDDDHFGRSLTSLGDLDGDGLIELAVGTRGDDDGGTDRGAVYILSLETLVPPIGYVTATRKISDTVGNFTKVFQDEDYFGTAITDLGDLDGDGINDMAVGELGSHEGEYSSGAVYILFLNADRTVKSYQKIDGTEGGFTGTLDDADYFGSALRNLGDLDGDGVIDIAVGASGDDDGGNNRGAVYVLFLNSNGTVKSHQKISDTAGNFTALLDDYDLFGGALASLGDMDGDGVGDIAVGVTGDDDGGSARGAVYVLFMNSDGTVKSQQKISDTLGGFTASLADFDLFGKSLTGVGDLDGDQIADLVVGATGDAGGGLARGTLYVLFLNANGTIKSYQKVNDIVGGFTAALENGDRLGQSLTNVGDMDGDGVTDLAVGTYRDDDGGTNRGAAYILLMNADGTVKSHLKISDTEGGLTGALDDFDWFGFSLANVGDIDGDGLNELAIGALRDDDGGAENSAERGAVYILSLDQVTPPGIVTVERKISDTAGNFLAILDDNEHFGRAVADLGDLDGDGINDLAIGATRDGDGGPKRGAVYTLFLNANGTVKSYQKISDTFGNFTAQLDDGDEFGSSIATIGDLDGDGVNDLAIGAQFDDDGGNGEKGAIYVLFLNTNGTVKSHQKISAAQGTFTAALDGFDLFGSSIANLGDVDGDGVTDLAVAAYGDDDGGAGRGAVYVLFLNSDGTVKSHQKISDTEGNFTADLENGRGIGKSLASLDDLDGDGVTDIVTGVIRSSDGGSSRGTIYVLFLNVDGTVKAYQTISDTAGNFDAHLDDFDRFGYGTTSLGDLDGDGVTDLAVGAVLDDDGGDRHGAVYILFLNENGTVKNHKKISDTQGNFKSSLDDLDIFGFSLSSLRDIDGDGLPELVVGTYRDDDGGNDRGAIYILSLAGVPTPPVPMATSVNGGVANRSGIQEFTITFDQAVTLGSPTALNLFNHSTGLPVDLTNAVLMGDGTTTVTWVLHDGPGGMTDVVLADGRYTAELPAGATTPSLAQSHTFAFHKLTGDVSGDGTVSFTDYGVVQANFAGSGSVFRAGDASGDGTVSFTDYGTVQSNFAASLPALPLDFGDAPDSATFPTTLANNGARHVITGNTLFLGATRDAEANGQSSAGATGDGADEDGIVVSGGSLQFGVPVSVTVTASVP
ncbi:MAG: FG-GAP repeat protein, partial [Planctomycetaceae bacterium]|nr:FG-GAP repeat protein [Planctomycetaceae bacterium]